MGVEWSRRESGSHRASFRPRLPRGNHDQYEKNIEQYPDAQDNESDHHSNLPKTNEKYELTLASWNSEEKVLKEPAGRVRDQCPSRQGKRWKTRRRYLFSQRQPSSIHALGYGRRESLWIPDEYGHGAYRRQVICGPALTAGTRASLGRPRTFASPASRHGRNSRPKLPSMARAHEAPDRACGSSGAREARGSREQSRARLDRGERGGAPLGFRRVRRNSCYDACPYMPRSARASSGWRG
jgi:hypothetical protein